MAVREISTRLTLEGENSFNNALKAMNRNMKLLGAELENAKVNFGGADQKQQLLAKTSELLNDKMRQQQNIVALLEQELGQAEQAWGKNDQRVDRLRVSLVKAQTELTKINRELDENGRELRENVAPARRFGNSVEDNITEKAEEAKKALDGMLKGMSEDLGSIKLSSWLGTATDIAGMIGDVWSGLDGFTEGTRDYRRMMAFLAMNAEEAGEDFARVKNMAMEVAALTGDMDGAVEGLSNLLAAGYKGDGLVDMANKLASAAIKWPETLKFENLAESLQETLATGEATGNFAEMLERLGFALTDVNSALAKSGTDEGRKQDINAFLGITDLETYYKEFAEKNADLLNEAMANEKWQAAMANIGTKIAKHTTQLKSEFADVIDAWADSLSGENGSHARLLKELDDVGAIFKNWGASLDTWVKAKGDQLAQAMIDDAAAALKRAQEILSGEKPMTEGETNQLKEAGLTAAQLGVELTQNMFGVGGLSLLPGNGVETQLELLRNARKAVQALLPKYLTPIGPELPENLIPKYESPIGPELPEEMKNTGLEAGNAAGEGLAEGLAAQQAAVDKQMELIMLAVNEQISNVKPIEIKIKDNTGTGTGTGETHAGGGAAGDPLEFTLNLDGATIGRVMTPYISREQAKKTNTKLRTNWA